MNSTIVLLTGDEIKQIIGGEKNETVISEVNTDFKLTEHTWILGGIIVGVFVFAILLNGYCCYKRMFQAGGYTSDQLLWKGGHNHRDVSVFLIK